MPSTSMLRVRGHRLRVSDSGAGPPLLLVMGMGGRIENWGRLLDQFPGRRVIAVDHPGMGQSSTPLLPHPMCALADLYAALLDELRIGSADVLGYSFGGAVAQEMARRHPHRINRLILAATLPAPWMAPLAPTVMSAAILSGRTRKAGMRLRYRGIAQQAAAICLWTSLPWLHTLPHRTLVLTGGSDRLVPPAVGEILAARIPDARLHVIDGADHMFLCERDDVAPLIDGFLTEGVTVPQLVGKTETFRIASVAGIDRALKRVAANQAKCVAGKPGYGASLWLAYQHDVDLLLDARNALANAREVEPAAPAP
jgi:poly(3-hydroxyoctanoate) depolymerase